jgi:hypothetical protein
MLTTPKLRNLTWLTGDGKFTGTYRIDGFTSSLVGENSADRLIRSTHDKGAEMVLAEGI